MTDMIVSRIETRDLPERGQVSLLFFHRGQVLMVGAAAVGLYRDEQAITDPLGNGTLGYQPIPDVLQPPWDGEQGFIHEQLAGCVTLTSGAVLFIRPDGIALYDDGLSALRNQNRHWLIPFSSP